MANSPSHTIGQIIGDRLEAAVKAPLQQVANQFGLYMDFKHPRTARGGHSLVSWTDLKGNKHDLDYVLESGGSDAVIGVPRAFIESAWRRYTKHSKNKAQEIEGAVGHLRQKYADAHPFIGVVLAGEFTKPSIDQLKSHGFSVLYFPYAAVVQAYLSVGVDISFGEASTDIDVQAKVDACKALSVGQNSAVEAALLLTMKTEVATFVEELKISLSRILENIFIMPLHGKGLDFSCVADARDFLKTYDEDRQISGFVRYEIILRYSNGSIINAQRVTQAEALEFLDRMI